MSYSIHHISLSRSTGNRTTTNSIPRHYSGPLCMCPEVNIQNQIPNLAPDIQNQGLLRWGTCVGTLESKIKVLPRSSTKLIWFCRIQESERIRKPLLQPGDGLSFERKTELTSPTTGEATWGFPDGESCQNELVNPIWPFVSSDPLERQKDKTTSQKPLEFKKIYLEIKKGFPPKPLYFWRVWGFRAQPTHSTCLARQ